MGKETTAADDNDLILPEDERNPNEDLDAEEPVAKDVDDTDIVDTEEDEKLVTDEEPEDEAPAEPEPESGNKGPMIPKSRYDSAKNRAQEAERRTQELERKLAEIAEGKTSTQTQTNTDVDTQLAELDKKLGEAYADNDMEAAASLRAQQRAIEREQIKADMTESDKLSSQHTIEQLKLDEMIETLNNTYEVLDPDSDAYDQDIVNEVLELQDAFVNAGRSPSSALQQAVRYARLEDTVKAAVAEPEAPAAEKRKTDVKRNVETANKQPPDLDKTGVDSNKSGLKDVIPDVTGLSEDEFDALPEETRRRMRGDVL